MGENNDKMEAPGSFVLAIIFLVWFIIIYFVQWAALSDSWPIG